MCGSAWSSKTFISIIFVDGFSVFTCKCKCNIEASCLKRPHRMTTQNHFAMAGNTTRHPWSVTLPNANATHDCFLPSSSPSPSSLFLPHCPSVHFHAKSNQLYNGSARPLEWHSWLSSAAFVFTETLSLAHVQDSRCQPVLSSVDKCQEGGAKELAICFDARLIW